MKMNMNNEIQKYKGRIYYYEQSTHEIVKADWINTTEDYNHWNFELHHVVPYTDWEEYIKLLKKEIKLPPKYNNMPKDNALILIPKKMHQHLQNPMYKLSKSDFERIWGIHPDSILYDINSRQPREKEIFTKTQIIYYNPGEEKITNISRTDNSPGTFFNKRFSELNLDDLTQEDIDNLPNRAEVLCQE